MQLIIISGSRISRQWFVRASLRASVAAAYAKQKAALGRALSNIMRGTSKQETTGVNDRLSGGLLTFQAPPQGRKQGPLSATPQLSHAALKRSLAKETLTEIDRISMFATQLDALLAGIEEEPIRTVAIHLFVQLTGNSDAVDIAKLSAQTDLSRREVKRALYMLTLAGKAQRLSGKNPRRYKLLVNGGTP